MVLCNTSKGIFLFEQCKDKIDSIKVSIDDCLQHNLKKPSLVIHSKCINFKKDYNKKGLVYVLKSRIEI